MEDGEWLARRFEEHRGHLRMVAYRMLGSVNEAEDAVQEAWLRLNRSATDDVQNLGGWLTTVVGRVCLDMLRSRTSRREEPLDLHAPPSARSRGTDADVGGDDPEHQALLADSIEVALLVVLETLAPAERVAFVLHDMFGLPFDEIAMIVGRSPAATRQLASRARRRVRGSAPELDADVKRRSEVVEAFLAASRGGDFAALLAVLDPGVTLRADATAAQMGAMGDARGAQAVAKTFSGRARAARPALIDGVPGAVWSYRGQPRVVFDFTVVDGKIVAIDMLADAGQLAELELTFGPHTG